MPTAREYARLDAENLRRLSEQLYGAWESTSSTFSASDSMPVGSYQVEVEIPEPFQPHSQEVDNFEIREIGRDGSVFRGEDVVRKEVRLTEIPRKKVKECGVAVFCKKNFK